MSPGPGEHPPRPNPAPDPVARGELLREYREFVRTRHPDRGGDPDEFARGLTRYRELLSGTAAVPGTGPRPAADTTIYRRGSLPAQVWRRLTERHRRRQKPRVE